PAQEAFMPLAALLFRTGMVRAGVQPLLLTASQGTIAPDQAARSSSWGSFGRFWGQAGVPQVAAIQRRTALQIVPRSARATVNFAPALTSGLILSDTGEILWDTGQRLLTLNAPSARLLLGKVGGKNVAVGDVRFQVGSMGGNEHAYLGLIALDGQPLTSAR